MELHPIDLALHRMQHEFSASRFLAGSAGSTAIKAQNTHISVAALLVCLTGLSLYGCGTNTEMSKKDQENFRGGPPPADFGARSEKQKAEAEKRVPASYKEWQKKRDAALGNHGAAPANATTTP